LFFIEISTDAVVNDTQQTAPDFDVAHGFAGAALRRSASTLMTTSTLLPITGRIWNISWGFAFEVEL
jgi:hypothetical protein